MTRPILPLAEELLGSAKTFLHANHPKSQNHLERGRWATVLQGFKAQEQAALARVAAECSAARIPTAQGDELLDLLRSEFDAEISKEPTKAVGSLTLRRYGATFTPGLIRKGTRFKTVANAESGQKEAQLVSIEPVFVGSTDNLTPINGGYYQDVFVNVQATEAGTAANAPSILNVLNGEHFDKIDPLFASGFIVWDGDCAGGSASPSIKLKSLGKALAQGQYGPTVAAIVAGLLTTPGVSRIAISEDFVRGGVCAWIADDSWAYSTRLGDMALQNVHNFWRGWGCKVLLGRVFEYPIAVSVSVVLRDKRYAGDTTDILANVRAAVSSYFNDRADWYTWTIDGLVGAVVRSDRRILCVKQNLGTPLCLVMTKAGNVLAEPVQSLGTDSSVPKYHWAISDTNIQVSFSTPQGA